MLDLENAKEHVTDSHSVPGYTRDDVAYHLALIVKAGYAEGPQPRYSSSGGDPTVPLAVIASRLTPAGHDFIATLRSDTVWSKVKERATRVGGSVSLEVLGQMGTAVAKELLGLP